MLPILLSVVVISFASAIVPGPILAVTLAKSHKSRWAGFQIALGHATIEVHQILPIYFGFGFSAFVALSCKIAQKAILWLIIQSQLLVSSSIAKCEEFE